MQDIGFPFDGLTGNPTDEFRNFTRDGHCVEIRFSVRCRSPVERGKKAFDTFVRSGRGIRSISDRSSREARAVFCVGLDRLNGIPYRLSVLPALRRNVGESDM